MNNQDTQIEQRISELPKSLSYTYFLNQFESQISNVDSTYLQFKQKESIQMSIEQTTLTSSDQPETINYDQNECTFSEQSHDDNGYTCWNKKYKIKTHKYTSQPQKQNQLVKKKTIHKIKDSLSSNHKSQMKITKQPRRLQQQEQKYEIHFVQSKNFEGQENTLHIQGGLVISKFDKSSKNGNKSQLNDEKLQKQDDFNPRNVIFCTQYENHIFHNYFIIKLSYVSKPIPEISQQKKMNFFSDKLNKTLKIKQQLKVHLKQKELSENRLQISKIIEEKISIDQNFPSLFQQREQLQNEQLTQFINQNLTEQSIYTFHVFLADFNHKEVNLNKIGFSHKLLQLLNFNFQKCSIQQCQELFNQFFSHQTFEQLQLECFSLVNNNDMKDQNKHIQIQINTFDNLLITCNAQIQMMEFQYPSHIYKLFGTLNERVYFIKYEIQTSHLQNICQQRSQNLNNFTQSKSKNLSLKSHLVKQSLYTQKSSEFIQKYYSVESSIQKEIERINQIEEQEKISSFLFKNQYQYQDYLIRALPSDNEPLSQIQKKQSLQQKKSLEEEFTSKNDYTNQLCNPIKFSEQTNFLKNQTEKNNYSEYSQISSSTLSCSQSQHIYQKNLTIQSFGVNNQVIENQKNANSHLAQIQKSSYQHDSLISNIDNKNEYQQFINKLDVNLDIDEDEDDYENDIDILILKIQLIKQYQQQMQQLKQNQKLIQRQNYMLQLKQSKDQLQQLSMNIEENNDDDNNVNNNKQNSINSTKINLQQQNSYKTNQNLHQNFSNELNKIIIINENSYQLEENHSNNTNLI